jgi:hypothetical protein
VAAWSASVSLPSVVLAFAFLGARGGDLRRVAGEAGGEAGPDPGAEVRVAVPGPGCRSRVRR